MWLPRRPIRKKNWCGPGCLAYLLEQFDIRAREEEIVAQIGEDVEKMGSSFLGLRTLAERYGLQLRALEVDWASLHQLPMPAIAHMRNNHFVVLCKVVGDHVTLYDPFLGTLEMHQKEFCMGWSASVLAPFSAPRPRSSDSIAQSETARGVLARAREVVRPYSGGLVLAFSAVVFNSLLAIAMPLAFYYLIDQLLTSGRGVTNLAILVGLISLSQVAIFVGGRLIYSFVSNGVLYDLRAKFISKVMNLPHSALFRLSPADLLSRLLNDVSIVQQFMSSTIFSIFVNGASLVVVLLAIFLLDWRLGLTTTLTVCGVGAVYYKYQDKIETATAELLQKKADLTAQSQHMLGHFEVIQQFGRQELEVSRLRHILVDQWATAYQLDKLGAYSSGLSSIFTAMGSLLVLWWGGGRVLSGEMTLGLLAALTMLTSQAFQFAVALVRQNLDVKAIQVAIQRYYEVVDLPTSDPAPTSLPDVRGEIEFRDVSFKYPNGYALQNMSFRIPPGSITAVVGPNGGGKSTLVSLILGNFEPTAGEILLDGCSITQFSKASLRAHVSYVPHDPRLFDGTIRDNIVHGRLYATEEEIEEAVRLSGLGHQISSFPDGLETRLVRQGANLSAGQRQMVAVARTILRRPRIIVCDEATSNYDGDNEAHFVSSIQKLFPNATIFVISHRPWVLEKASTLLLVQSGTVVPLTTKQQRELLARTMRAQGNSPTARPSGVSQSHHPL